MARHRPVTLPPPGLAIHLAALHALAPPSVVWQTAAATVVESRETWPDGTAGLSPTPADPETAGWTRLTPAP